MYNEDKEDPNAIYELVNNLIYIKIYKNISQEELNKQTFVNNHKLYYYNYDKYKFIKVDSKAVIELTDIGNDIIKKNFINSK